MIIQNLDAGLNHSRGDFSSAADLSFPDAKLQVVNTAISR